MPWIRTISVAEATGRLAQIYDAAIARAGKVFGIVRAMSVDPETLDSSMALYQRVMLARGALPRRQREMLAVVVSSANSCHY
jgi:alkylhydroperoxidase family enzyme